MKATVKIFLLALLSMAAWMLGAHPVMAEEGSTTVVTNQTTEHISLVPETTSVSTERETSSQEAEPVPSTLMPTTEVGDGEPEEGRVEAETEAAESLEEASLYRLYHPGLRVHLYTKDSNEYRVLGSRGWLQEGEAWKVSLKIGDKVYRLYHPGLQIHLFTKDENEYRQLATRGWKQEGSAFRSYGGMPIYRLYHPGVKRHLYTKDAGEYQILGQRGWKQEGVAFYGLGWPANQIPPQAGNLAGKLTIQEVNQQKGSFEILISGISSPKGVQSILVPVWSAEKGQDDLVWYQARPVSNGVFRVQVESRNHQYNQGIYHIHLYYKTLENQMVFVTSGQHQVEIRQTTVEGKVTIQEVSHQRGNFTVTVSELFAPAGIKQVLLPVWTEANGQDDIRWYTANRQANGDYQATIFVADHRFQSGMYQVHAYVKLPSGRDVGIGSQSVRMNFEGLRYNGNYFEIHGKYGYVPIVNKKHPVNPAYHPGENPSAKAAFDALTNQMRGLGFGISYSYSGFRSYATQHSLYWSYVSQHGQAAADRFSARPGYSEHQTGLAFDVFGTGGGLLAQPNAVHWLAHNAHRYGFIVRYQAGKEGITGYMAEPWHIRYLGPEAADIYQSGLSLEEYYGVAGGGY